MAAFTRVPRSSMTSTLATPGASSPPTTDRSASSHADSGLYGSSWRRYVPQLWARSPVTRTMPSAVRTTPAPSFRPIRTVSTRHIVKGGRPRPTSCDAGPPAAFLALALRALGRLANPVAVRDGRHLAGGELVVGRDVVRDDVDVEVALVDRPGAGARRERDVDLGRVAGLDRDRRVRRRRIHRQLPHVAGGRRDRRVKRLG